MLNSSVLLLGISCTYQAHLNHVSSLNGQRKPIMNQLYLGTIHDSDILKEMDERSAQDTFTLYLWVGAPWDPILALLLC